MGQIAAARSVVGTLDEAGAIIRHRGNFRNDPGDSVAQAQIINKFFGGVIEKAWADRG